MQLKLKQVIYLAKMYFSQVLLSCAKLWLVSLSSATVPPSSRCQKTQAASLVNMTAAPN